MTTQRNPKREEAAQRAATQLRAHLGMPAKTKTAIILGTGWGDALVLEKAKRVPLSGISGFQWLRDMPSIPGHARELEYGHLEGRGVAILHGRLHLNEAPASAHLHEMVRLQVEMLCHLGVEELILTCAAGSLRRRWWWPNRFSVGDVVAVNGLVTMYAPDMPLWAGEFDMPEAAISERLVCGALRAKVNGLKVRTGAYAMVRGPQFESRRDKRILARAGADAVGMSVLPELAVAALYEDVEALPLAFITNSEVEKHDHETNRERAKKSSALLGELLHRVALGW